MTKVLSVVIRDSLESMAALRRTLGKSGAGLEGFQEEMLPELWLKG